VLTFYFYFLGLEIEYLMFSVYDLFVYLIHAHGWWNAIGPLLEFIEPLSSEEGKTQQVRARRKQQLMLKPRPDFGLDCLISAEFARRRTLLTVFSAGWNLGFRVWV